MRKLTIASESRKYLSRANNVVFFPRLISFVMAVADMKSSVKVRSVLLLVAIFFAQTSHILRAQPRKVWESRVLATSSYMQQKMWNPNNGNFIRRTDAPPAAQKSDAWGITIVLDAYSYM